MAKTRERTETVTKIEVAGRWYTIDVPVSEHEHGYCQRHVEARLTQKQAETLRAIRSGLDGQKMLNGRYVQSAADAIRWILDQIPLFLGGSRPNDPSNPKLPS